MNDLAERRAFAARIAFLRRKADFHFERSKERYRRWRLKTKYDPNQPRVPAGQGGGGRWTDGDGSGGTPDPARRIAQLDERVLAQARTPADVERRCEEQFSRDGRYCATLPYRRRSPCRAHASARYAACLAGQPIPPLPY
jgi:hypothetical protein